MSDTVRLSVSFGADPGALDDVSLVPGGHCPPHRRAGGGSASRAVNFTLRCREGEFDVEKSHECPNGRTVTEVCDGTAYTKRGECQRTRFVCNAWDEEEMRFRERAGCVGELHIGVDGSDAFVLADAAVSRGALAL